MVSGAYSGTAVTENILTT